MTIGSAGFGWRFHLGRNLTFGQDRLSGTSALPRLLCSSRTRRYETLGRSHRPGNQTPQAGHRNDLSAVLIPGRAMRPQRHRKRRDGLAHGLELSLCQTGSPRIAQDERRRIDVTSDTCPSAGLCSQRDWKMNRAPGYNGRRWRTDLEGRDDERRSFIQPRRQPSTAETIEEKGKRGPHSFPGFYRPPRAPLGPRGK